MRPNFKKPHHIASWHLRCIRHRRHRYCSDLFDLVISCLDLFILVAILKCKMVPGQHLRDGSQEVFRIRVMNIAKCNSIPQSVSRYWVPQEHVVVNYMTTWVCRVQYVCVSLQVYSRVGSLDIHTFGIFRAMFHHATLRMWWPSIGEIPCRTGWNIKERSLTDLQCDHLASINSDVFFLTFRRLGTFRRHDSKLKIAMVQLLDWCVFVCVCVKIWKKLFGSKTARATKETNLCLWASGRHIEVESGTLRNTKNAKAIDWPWFVWLYIYSSSFIYIYICVYIYTSY